VRHSMNRGLAVIAALSAMGLCVAGVGLFFVMGASRAMTKLENGFSGALGGPMIPSSPRTAEVRKVGPFDGITASSSFEVVVTKDEAPLTVSAEKDLLPLISTEVKDGTLVVKWTKPVNTNSDVVVSVGAPQLRRLTLSGAASGTVTGTGAGPFQLKLSGASKANISGESESLVAALDGASSADVRLEKLQSSEVAASGASRLTLVGSGKSLDAELSGGSEVDAAGPFEMVTVDVSGASRLKAKATVSMEGKASGASSVDTMGSAGAVKVSSSGASQVR
jgi:hypothetical protein